MSEPRFLYDQPPGALACRLDDWSDDVVRVVARGEIDLSTASTLEHALRDAHARGSLVLLDLRGVSFCDSTGLHVVVSADQRARQSGRRLVVVPGPQQVRRLFALAGLGEQLEIVEDPAMIADDKPEPATVADGPDR